MLCRNRGVDQSWGREAAGPSQQQQPALQLGQLRRIAGPQAPRQVPAAADLRPLTPGWITVQDDLVQVLRYLVADPVECRRWRYFSCAHWSCWASRMRSTFFVVRLDAGARQGAAATAAATARSRGPTRETVAQTAAAAALAAAAGGGPPPVPAAAAAMASRMPAAAWPAIGATAPTMIRAGADGASSGAAGRTAAVQTMTGAARMVVRTPGQVTPWSAGDIISYRHHFFITQSHERQREPSPGQSFFGHDLKE